MRELSDLLRPRGGETRLIDIRDPAAFERGHIPGSSRVGIDEVDRRYVLPSRRRRVVVVAEDSARALQTARLLRSNGYDARALSDPLSTWSGEWEVGPERAPAWEPSPLVLEWSDRLGGLSNGVDLGCGSGRDAVHLAMRGLRVTAIDLLPDAIAQGRRLAERHGVSVSFVCADIARDPGCWTGPWDLINVQRFLDRRSLLLLGGRLREGGYLLYQGFLERQAESGRKPRRRSHLLGSGELREAAVAQGLRIVHYYEGRDDEGDWTASLVARGNRFREPRQPSPSVRRGEGDGARGREGNDRAQE